MFSLHARVDDKALRSSGLAKRARRGRQARMTQIRINLIDQLSYLFTQLFTIEIRRAKYDFVLYMQAVVLILLLTLFFPFELSAAKASKDVLSESTVSVSIGTYTFSLYGYSSPYAQVTIQGNGVFDQTVADKNGYFEFKNKFSPFIPREACITSRDQLGRNSQPVCLPPFPTKYNVTIGPVIIPPTLSFNESTYYVNDEVVLTGQTIPQSNVTFSLFKDRDRLLQIIAPHSLSFPKIETSADKGGNFSISLPSSKANAYRVFTQTEFNDQDSPKSLTLHFSIYPVWFIIIQYLWLLWDLIKSRLIEMIILVELIALSYYLLWRHLHPRRVTSLALRERYSLMLMKKTLALMRKPPTEK